MTSAQADTSFLPFQEQFCGAAFYFVIIFGSFFCFLFFVLFERERQQEKGTQGSRRGRSRRPAEQGA